MENKYLKKIIIGTWSISGDFGQISKKNIYEILEESVRNNFLEFDTAPTYGQGRIHKILSEMFKNNKEIKINTKCGYNSAGVKTFKISDIIKSIDNSLKEFGRINTLFLHNPRTEIKNWFKILKLLKTYKKKNEVKNIGISFARNFYFSKNIMNNFDYLQDEINLLRPHNINFLSSLKPKLVARSPLASGCLSGKININSKFKQNDYRSKWLLDKQRLKNILFQINEIKKISGRNLRQFSKFFLLQNNSIDNIIFGIKKKSHIKELVTDIKNFEKINELNITRIQNLANLNFNLSGGQIGY